MFEGTPHLAKAGIIRLNQTKAAASAQLLSSRLSHILAALVADLEIPCWSQVTRASLKQVDTSLLGMRSTGHGMRNVVSRMH